MKLNPYKLGDSIAGWHSDDPASLYWYKTDSIRLDGAPTPPTELIAYSIGHTGIVQPSTRTIQIADLTFIGAGIFGEPRDSGFGNKTQWTGDSYRYGIYIVSSDPRRHVIIRQDGGGIYTYLDHSFTNWPAICRLLPNERLWDLCQTIGHTFHQGRESERRRIYNQFANGRLKLKRKRNAVMIVETPEPMEATNNAN